MVETTASLRIISDTLSNDEITTLLNATPTTTFTKGSLASPRNPRSLRRPANVWIIESVLPRDRPLCDHIGALVQFITDRKDAFAIISKDCRMDMFCGLFTEAQGGVVLDAAVIRQLANLQYDVDIVLDIYACSEG